MIHSFPFSDAMHVLWPILLYIPVWEISGQKVFSQFAWQILLKDPVLLWFRGVRVWATVKAETLIYCNNRTVTKSTPPKAHMLGVAFGYMAWLRNRSAVEMLCLRAEGLRPLGEVILVSSCCSWD